MKCPICKETEHEPNAKYCHVCGALLSSDKYYPHAGEEQPQPNQKKTPNTGYNNGSSNNSIQVFKVKGVEFKMIRVDGGTFMMGAHGKDDDWVKEYEGSPVTLDTFWIGETEVTQELWEAVMGNNPSAFKRNTIGGWRNLFHSTYKQRPVDNVSWEDCQEFIGKLNRLTHKKFRLPTSAEWEYAARGGQQSRGFKYAGSNSLEDVAWYVDNSGEYGGIYNERDLQKLTKNHRQTHPVKQKLPNELGIYDMSGNVYEWCQETVTHRDDSYGPDDFRHIRVEHISRGGSFWRGPEFCLIVDTLGGNSNDETGFRLVI